MSDDKKKDADEVKKDVEMYKSKLDYKKVEECIEKSWEDSVLETLKTYITIKNQSPSYDSEIYTNGYQEKACKLLVNWVNQQKIKGLKLEVLQDKNKTPLIFIEIDGTTKEANESTMLMYGHFDKQPPLTPDWDDDLGPYKPVIKDGKLYGRGGADDGYSIFGSIDAVKAIQQQGLNHNRIIIVVEGSEESGSPHLDYYLEKLRKRIGIPKVVFCLDSGCLDYKRLWMTVSLRGLIIATIKASLLKEGIHSGSSGLVRDSFHIIRNLLDKIEDSKTGKFNIKEFIVNIPKKHIDYQKQCAKVLGKSLWETLPLHKDCEPQLPKKLENVSELLLNKTWRPQLAITGIDGIPDLKGGNVLRKETILKLSIRIPPSLKPDIASKALVKELNKNKLCNAKISVDCGISAEGFVNNDFDDWLSKSMNNASRVYYNGNNCEYFGEGGTIPLMGQLQKQFPKSQFIVTGVLGPKSNAHGPNEFLDIAFTKKIICCVTNILYDSYEHFKK